MTIFWPALLLGIGAVVAGVVVLRHRDRIARFTADMQQDTFGDGATARRFREGATGRSMLYPGIGALLIGTTAIVLSFLGLDW